MDSFIPLTPLESSPSGGRHLNWTVAIVGVGRPFLLPPAKEDPGRAGVRKSVLFEGTLSPLSRERERETEGLHLLKVTGDEAEQAGGFRSLASSTL